MHVQSYPVNLEVKIPEQPHIETYEKRSTPGFLRSGWFAFVTAGFIALFFLVAIYTFGRRTVFPNYLDPYEGLIPIIKQGSLYAYPIGIGQSNGIKKFYSVQLPLDDVTETVATFQKIFNSYPKEKTNHRYCWLENPVYNESCYFDVHWLQETCSDANNFGYSEYNLTYSPCFLLQIENSGNWKPLPLRPVDVPSFSDHYDPGFFEVFCAFTDANGLSYPIDINIYPRKGFSVLYFPISNFNPNYYMPPLVAVKVSSIPKGINITVECAIFARNSMLLVDNGVVSINFETS